MGHFWRAGHDRHFVGVAQHRRLVAAGALAGGLAAGWYGRGRSGARAWRVRAPADSGLVGQRPAWRHGALAVADQLDLLDHVGDSAGIGFYHWNVVSERGAVVAPSPQHVRRRRRQPGHLALSTSACIRTTSTASRRPSPRAFARAQDYVHEYRIRLDSGELRTIRGSGRISFDGAGRPLRMSGAVIDVSAATEARLAVMQRERELAAIIENLPDVITRFDLQQRHLFVSPCIEAITGMPPSAFIGKTNEELGMDALMCARWRAVLDDVIRNGIVRELEFSFFDPQGKEHFFVTRAIPDFDGAGAVESVMTIASDHTAARSGAARRLRASEALLQQADLRKNEYLATLAHELRGPLAPIATAVQLMKLSERREVWQKRRQVIERQVAQLVELVDDLMDVGRISSGKLVLRLARVALQPASTCHRERAAPVRRRRPAIDGEHARRSRLAAGRRHPPDPDLYQSADQCGQVLGRAGAQVTCRPAWKAQGLRGGQRYGIGLTAAAMDDDFRHVFAGARARRTSAGRPWYRPVAGAPTGELAPGENRRGQRRARQGRAIFGAPAAGAGSRQRPPARRACRPRPPMPPRQVLVVDDNVDGADTLVALLAALGHQPTASTTARTPSPPPRPALRPGLARPGPARHQRHPGGPARARQTLGPRSEMVALTGLGQQHDRDLTRLAGFNLHLVKPVRIDDLLALVGDASTSSSASA